MECTACKTRIAPYLLQTISWKQHECLATWHVWLCLPWCAMMSAWRQLAGGLIETLLNNVNNRNDINKMNKHGNMCLLLLTAISWYPSVMLLHVSRTRKPSRDFWKFPLLYVSNLNYVQSRTRSQRHLDPNDHWAYSVYLNPKACARFNQPCPGTSGRAWFCRQNASQV